MAFDTLDGASLGARHKDLNRLVNEAVKAEEPFDEIANIPETSDLVRLYKISVAAKYKNLDYIIENLKCDDMLYVSTAINTATWLITDEKYAHIINPNYLNENLYPKMLTKAVNKFNLAIRLHLKDCARVENFFNHYYENGSTEIAFKWLKNCSKDFKRQIVKEHGAHMKIDLLKVLCEHDHEIFQILVSIEEFSKRTLLTQFKHILFKETQFFMNLESDKDDHAIFSRGDSIFNRSSRRAKKLLIKNYFEISMSKFEVYGCQFDWNEIMPLISKATARELILSNWERKLIGLENATNYLTEEDIKLKIDETFKKENFSVYDFKILINALSETERIDFVKNHISEILKRKCFSVDDLQTFIDLLPQKEKVDIAQKYIIEILKRKHFSVDDLKSFINLLPQKEKFEIVQKYIIENEFSLQRIKDMSEADLLYWYSYVQFDIAFTDLKQMIRTSKDHMTRIDIISVLVKIACDNEKQIYQILKYFLRKHINEPTHVREMFLKNIVLSTKTHKFEQPAWQILNDLFNNLEIFKKGNFDEFSYCIYAIIVYNLLHNLDIPDDMIDFLDSGNLYELSHLKDKLDETEREILFNFVLNKASVPIMNSPFCVKNPQTERNDAELYRLSNAIENKYKLIKLWDKNILDYPELYLLIRELLLWKYETKSLTKIYIPECREIRRLLFDVLLLINCDEKTLLYTLKYSVTPIQDYNESVNDLLIDRKQFKQPRNTRHRGNRKMRTRMRDPRKQPPISFLTKTRVYFADSLAKSFLSHYTAALDMILDEEDGHKSIAHGICLLMQRDDFEEIIQKYLPEKHKIDWSEEKVGMLNIRKYFAQFLSKVRPVVNFDVISKFADGDYLQWVKPCVESYFSTISQDKFIEIIPIVIKGPISLKKMCLRFAHNRLSTDEYLEFFDKMWTEHKNPSIRAVLFTKLKESLEEESDEGYIEKHWQLLKKMLNELTQDEEKTMYEALAKFEKLPEYVKSEYFLTGFKVLKSLPEKRKCTSILDESILNSLQLVGVIDDTFYFDFLFEQFNNLITNKQSMNDSVKSTKEVIISLIVESSMENRFKSTMPRFMDGIKKIWNQHVSDDESKDKLLGFLIVWILKLMDSFRGSHQRRQSVDTDTTSSDAEDNDQRERDERTSKDMSCVFEAMIENLKTL